MSPPNLLDSGYSPGESWVVVYTLSRREKELARRLLALDVPFYCPQYAHRHRSPSGRLRESFQPLFPGYLFLKTDVGRRDVVLSTNCVSRWIEVTEPSELVADLQQLQRVLMCGRFVTPERQLEPGDPVRIVGGTLAGMTGKVFRRGSETRLYVMVNFLQQGASVELDEVDVVRNELVDDAEPREVSR